jgi:hypothetical protein
MKLPYQSAFTRYLPLAILIVVIAVSCRAFSQTQPVLPDKPQLKTSSMRNFWIVAGVDAAATFADAYATNDSLNHGCLEKTPFFGGAHPSPARVYGTMFGIMATEQTASYFLRRSGHHKLWLVPMFTNSGMHLEGAIHSAKCL